MLYMTLSGVTYVHTSEEVSSSFYLPFAWAIPTSHEYPLSIPSWWRLWSLLRGDTGLVRWSGVETGIQHGIAGIIATWARRYKRKHWDKSLFNQDWNFHKRYIFINHPFIYFHLTASLWTEVNAVNPVFYYIERLAIDDLRSHWWHTESTVYICFHAQWQYRIGKIITPCRIYNQRIS